MEVAPEVALEAVPETVVEMTLQYIELEPFEHIKCEPQMRCQKNFYFKLEVGFWKLGSEKLERMTRASWAGRFI